MLRLSIITINRDNSEGLRKTIQSVVSQSYTDFEFIIIDGASTDGSVDVIKEYADKISYWVSEPDTGIYNAMNKGIAVAKGEYLQFLNSGDRLCTAEILENVFNVTRNEDLLYGNIYTDFGKGELVPDVYPDEITAYRLFTTTICHQSIFHKRTLFEKDYYNENNQAVSDWEFLLKSVIIENCSISKLDLFIVCLDGVNSKNWGKVISEERKAVLKRYFPERVIDDYLYFRNILNDPFFKYLSIFNQYPKLRKTVKRLMKLLLFINHKKDQIPPQ